MFNEACRPYPVFINLRLKPLAGEFTHNKTRRKDWESDSAPIACNFSIFRTHYHALQKEFGALLCWYYIKLLWIVFDSQTNFWLAIFKFSFFLLFCCLGKETSVYLEQKFQASFRVLIFGNDYELEKDNELVNNDWRTDSCTLQKVNLFSPFCFVPEWNDAKTLAKGFIEAIARVRNYLISRAIFWLLKSRMLQKFTPIARGWKYWNAVQLMRLSLSTWPFPAYSYRWCRNFTKLVSKSFEFSRKPSFSFLLLSNDSIKIYANNRYHIQNCSRESPTTA